MPTIKRFGNMRVFINTDDHGPPHVHVRGPGYIAKVGIEDGVILDEAGRQTPAAKSALAWIRENGETIRLAWVSIHDARRI